MDFNRITRHFKGNVRDRVNGVGVAIDLVIGLVLFFAGQVLAQNKIYVVSGTTGQALAVVAGVLVAVIVVVSLVNAQRLVLRIAAVVLAVVGGVVVTWQWKMIVTAFTKGGWVTFYWFLLALVIFVIFTVWRNTRSKTV